MEYSVKGSISNLANCAIYFFKPRFNPTRSKLFFNVFIVKITIYIFKSIKNKLQKKFIFRDRKGQPSGHQEPFRGQAGSPDYQQKEQKKGEPENKKMAEQK